MSTWSNIIALVEVFSTIPGSPLPFRDAVETAINTAPKIYGSEGDALVKVVDWGLANDIDTTLRHLWLDQIYPWHICSCCAYKNKCKHKGECPPAGCKSRKRVREANKTDGYNGWLWPISATSRCMVYIHGNLRDTTPEQTQAEFKRLLEYIKNSYPDVGCPLRVKVVFKKIS